MNVRPFVYPTHATNRGFTLVEVLVVIIIITLLSSVVAVNLFDKPGEARQSTARLQIKNLQTAIQLYKTRHGVMPTIEQGLQALVKEPTRGPIPKNYPKEGYLDNLTVPVDPWGNPYIYLAPGRSGEAFEIISYGSDGEPHGDEEATDLSSSTL